MSAIALDDRRAQFGDRERGLLELVRDPISRIHATVLDREWTRRLLSELGDALDVCDRAVVILDGEGRIEFASPAARELAGRYRAAEELVTVLLEERPAPGPALTERELQVVELVRAGLMNAQIGERLTISTRTVERHLRNVYDKLGVRTRTAAVAKVFG